jgi:predicted metal-dependent HD superfamily phosphohydrolase
VFSCRHAPLALAAPVAVELAARYGEPHRAYHTAEHIAAMLRWYDVVAEGPGWSAPADVYLAVVFHDAIYDATRHDNEARSAALARTLAGASDRTVALIELTARHGQLTPADVADDPDAGHFLDSDMAILGAPADVFDRYDAGVRIEYAHVPDAAYRAGRGAFLAKVAALPRIYFTELFHARLDAAARANLARAIARLAVTASA